MTVTLAQMKDQLLTFDTVVEKLEKTEPMESIMIETGSPAKFRLESDWSELAKSSSMTDLVPAFATIKGKEYQFTKEGIFQALSTIGLKPTYAVKTPAHLIESQLDYWFNSGLSEAAYKMIVVRDAASAFIKPTIVPFSNLELIHSLYDGIQFHYGKETEVLADYKFHNSLGRTDVRLIVPSDLSVIKDSNMIDVPAGSPDVWSTGISLSNSLTGKMQTAIDAYAFRWFCTNGMTRQLDDIGTWSRRSDGQTEESVYEWAANAVDDVLGGMEHAFEKIQSLVYVKPKGNTADILKGIYNDHKVPVGNRNAIESQVISSNELHMYSILNAVSEQANDPTLSPERVDKLMKIAGAIPEHFYDMTKAKIFSQGQNAGPEAENPYLIQVAT